MNRCLSPEIPSGHRRQTAGHFPPEPAGGSGNEDHPLARGGRAAGHDLQLLPASRRDATGESGKEERRPDAPDLQIGSPHSI